MLDHLDQRPECICRPRCRLSGRERERAELELLPDLDPVPFLPVGIAGEERSQPDSAPSKAQRGGSAPAERSKEGASETHKSAGFVTSAAVCFRFRRSERAGQYMRLFLGHFFKDEIKGAAGRPSALSSAHLPTWAPLGVRNRKENSPCWTSRRGQSCARAFPLL